MPSRPVASLVALLLVLCTANAFAPTKNAVTLQLQSSLTPLFAKKNTEDLSYIESRDMTREEMVELNKKNEDIMNMELQMMTGFSLVISLPILYLCWVAFFSD